MDNGIIMESIIIFLLSFLILLLCYGLLRKNKNYPSMNKNTIDRERKLKRKCPLCGSDLSQEGDCVLGEYEEREGKRKVYIFGCNYCYHGKIRKYRIDL